MNPAHDPAPSPQMRQLGRSRPYELGALPARLRHWHAPRANRWECLRVLAGQLDTEWLGDDGIIGQAMASGAVRWIAPGTRWRVTGGSGEARFVLEIHADDATAAAAPQPLRAALLDAAPVSSVTDAAALERVLQELPPGSHCLLHSTLDPRPIVRAAIARSGARLSWHPLAAAPGAHVALLVRSTQPIDLPEYLGRDHAVIEAALAGALRGDAERSRWLHGALGRHLVIEERLLFPAYLAAGGREGWVRGLCHEHEHLRRDLARLDDPVAQRRFLLLLDGHDEKEEQIVYPDIVALTPAANAALLHEVLALGLSATTLAAASHPGGSAAASRASTP